MDALVSYRRGITLLEALLVVVALMILVGIVIFAVNPDKRLTDTRNAQRRADIANILDKVHRYSVDTNMLPATIAMTPTPICKSGTISCTGLTDLTVLVQRNYLSELPSDPTASTATSTGYSILKTESNHVVVSAPGAEGTTITVTR
jgi:hypothetical protein